MSELPKKIKGDVGHAVARAVLQSVPVAGGAISVLFEEVFSLHLLRKEERNGSKCLRKLLKN